MDAGLIQRELFVGTEQIFITLHFGWLTCPRQNLAKMYAIKNQLFAWTSFTGYIPSRFVQNGRNILEDGLDDGQWTVEMKHTFLLYLVVTLVARTPFLMLLVAR